MNLFEPQINKQVTIQLDIPYFIENDFVYQQPVKTFSNVSSLAMSLSKTCTSSLTLASLPSKRISHLRTMNKEIC